MNYKETLFFIGKCLTINHEEKNNIIIENQLKTKEIDWEAVVKLSTAHFVFPALYCNLKKANFLDYVPEELVNYMVRITDLNRERNQQIIEQAKEINELLLSNNITPIFLKGTGNLLEGLYEDIGERMVGDIDFIFSKEEYIKAIKLITDFGYTRVHKDAYDPISFKHYPRLQKKNRIAAVEIHKELLIEKYADEFNYSLIKKDAQNINNVNVMSFENQIALSIIAKQINDDGIYYKNIALRNAYDVFLLSKKLNSNIIFNNLSKLKLPLNFFLASCFIVFNKTTSLQYKSTKEIENYLSTFNKQLNDSKVRNKNYKRTERKLFLKARLKIIYKSIFDKTHRNWLIKRTLDKNWQQEKLKQLGFKKN
ncbi:nucleotidyltransferase family protein [uncultured Polaribacter sp.]|uniref:nucleotidyltransferase domain-containing protein n=1 Tax=uncultured Polaribacter sp. TaxID=174711 RepID=UPI00260D32A2|nr:nucleotidyltransferase family protein [uncultured Polaribacter sp.]